MQDSQYYRAPPGGQATSHKPVPGSRDEALKKLASYFRIADDSSGTSFSLPKLRHMSSPRSCGASIVAVSTAEAGDEQDQGRRELAHDYTFSSFSYTGRSPPPRNSSGW